MSRWLERARAALTRSSDNRAKSPDSFEAPHPIGAIGAIGRELRPALSPEWVAVDWRDQFEEWAAVAEFDGGQSRTDAERAALNALVDHWLAKTPPPSSAEGECAHCGDALPDVDAMAVTAGAEAVRVHRRCHRPLMSERRRQAIEALDAMGLPAGVYLK